MILEDDLAPRNSSLPRRTIPVGREGDQEVAIPAYNGGVLVSGASGSGKSTLVAACSRRSSKENTRCA